MPPDHLSFRALVLPHVGGLVFAGFHVAAAVFDLRVRRIPNALTAACALAGGVMLLVLQDQQAVQDASIAFALACCAGLLLQSLRLMGGGDVKLFAASAIWLRGATMDAALATAIAGGVLGFFFIRSSSRPSTARDDETIHRVGRLQLDDGPDHGRVPYGVAIAIGCLWTWFDVGGLIRGIS